VISLFRKKNPRQSDILRDVEIRLQDMTNRFSRIEKSLDHLSTKTPNIIIENVHIHQPVLEKMEYRLDKLDIEQLSGSLNLGNNFGAKISSDQSIDKADKTQKTDSTTRYPDVIKANVAAQQPPKDVSGLQRTASGFRFRRS
jgi:hypothetical protein